MKPILFSIFLLSVVCLIGVGNPKMQDEEKLDSIQERISKTTPEGLEILKKVQKMKPEINEKISGKTLENIVIDFSQEKGDYNIHSIGWAASKKKLINRWRINFYFQDYRKQYLTAEWEYNEEIDKLYPFEFQNAPIFWATPKRKISK